MTASDLYATFYKAGFKPVYAETMTAIALRESGGDPSAHNGDADTGDDSYGLVQINWLVPQVKALCIAHGVTDPSQLLNADTNARIAYALYGGIDRNLNTAWYIDIPGCPQHPRDYQTRYEAHLAAAHAAALAYRS